MDHNHDTNQIRKLLCSDCNSLLARVKDSILILEAAIKYLMEHQQ